MATASSSNRLGAKNRRAAGPARVAAARRFRGPATPGARRVRGHRNYRWNSAVRGKVGGRAAPQGAEGTLTRFRQRRVKPGPAEKAATGVAESPATPKMGIDGRVDALPRVVRSPPFRGGQAQEPPIAGRGRVPPRGLAGETGTVAACGIDFGQITISAFMYLSRTNSHGRQKGGRT